LPLQRRQRLHYRFYPPALCATLSRRPLHLLHGLLPFPMQSLIPIPYSLFRVPCRLLYYTYSAKLERLL
jgi:hypothetical protein